MREIIVDNFAGGGGTSCGIEEATGYEVDVAVNHDPYSISMHTVNHPNTVHYCEDVSLEYVLESEYCPHTDIVDTVANAERFLDSLPHDASLFAAHSETCERCKEREINAG
jgi:hypothetical protein